ncbi:ArsR/SmtB family transcription factor [Propionibacteriaceae bacterium Y1685]
MVNQTEVFAALGDQRRALIVSLLAQRPRSISELAGHVGISTPGTMKHLTVLESVGLVTRTKAGRVVTVRLEPQAFVPAEEWITRMRAHWEQQLDQLADSFTTREDPS